MISRKSVCSGLRLALAFPFLTCPWPSQRTICCCPTLPHRQSWSEGSIPLISASRPPVVLMGTGSLRIFGMMLSPDRLLSRPHPSRSDGIRPQGRHELPDRIRRGGQKRLGRPRNRGPVTPVALDAVIVSPKNEALADRASHQRDDAMHRRRRALMRGRLRRPQPQDRHRGRVRRDQLRASCIPMHDNLVGEACRSGHA